MKYWRDYRTNYKKSAAGYNSTPIFEYLQTRERTGVSPEMALRLSQALGARRERGLAMQHNRDLRQVKTTADPCDVQELDFEAA